jgi:GH15 family glucan-1,4-alpha-glucosidase
MSRPIEDYGFIGNTISCALIGRNASIDWLCLPRFDSDACFAALLGTREHGRWLIAPKGEVRAARRRYLPGTAVLETIFETAEGVVSVTDFMPPSRSEERVELSRIVRGIEGEVAMRMELILRFGYGRTVPWVRRRDYGLSAVAGPDAIELVTPVTLVGEDLTTCAELSVAPGQAVPFTLAYHPSNREPHFVDDREVALERTTGWWRKWSERCRIPPSAPADWADAVSRSAITLKALTYRPAGSLVAAPTTSLPERIGGNRNWDYRYCWIRDATLTLYALLNCGYFAEADDFRDWLLRAAAGHPEQLQIMYGLAGERRLTEIELPWLPGYQSSPPVRIGNDAHDQLQLDVYGELMDSFHAARKSRIGRHDAAWRIECVLLRNLARIWREPDHGIWETRGPPRHFTYSKLMAWVAFDRGVKAIEQFGLAGPLEEWQAARDEIRADILANGYDAERNTFVQHYGGKPLDAALLLIAQVGFLSADDRRFRGTVEAVERELVENGLVLRYRREQADDGLPGGEGAFLACSFWLADAYVQLDRYDEAAALFERLLAVRNDLGLLAEEYDPVSRRQLGNFPQAFSHVAMINTAYNLLQAHGPAAQRASRERSPQQGTAPPPTKPEAIDET